jgi:hydrogenase maturation factor HypF (carbamoyltransferase family)
MSQNQELIEILSSVSEPEPPEEPPAQPVAQSTAPIVPPLIEPSLIQAITPEPNRPPSSLVESQDDKNNINENFKRLIELFGTSVNEIIHNQHSDREQANSAIQIVQTQINQMIQNGNTKGIGVYLDAWARLLQTKAEINANAPRSMDSIAKLLSAAKSNDLIINIGGGAAQGTLNLEALLSQPVKDDLADESS